MSQTIELESEAPKCPKCKVGMKFEELKLGDIISDTRTINLPNGKTHELHYLSNQKIIGRLYRCQKCFNIYLVKEAKA